ncbi:MAG TPA: hypothetical protein VJN95_08915 [Gemmatimonadales bacterium]|nr:hypothetical protein [Gemmatimonadales bacterium]
MGLTLQLLDAEIVETRHRLELLEGLKAVYAGGAPADPVPVGRPRGRKPKAKERGRRVSTARRPTKAAASEGLKGWDAKRERLRQNVATYRKEHPEASLNEVAKALGSTWSTVKKVWA